MQLQLISSVLNRIPAVNGNYYKELQGIGIIGSLKKKRKKSWRGKKVGQDQHNNFFLKHPTIFKDYLTIEYTMMKTKSFNYFYKPRATLTQWGRKCMMKDIKHLLLSACLN